ncbi:MAG: hypothetical protein WDN69_28370 [Aliidongia sp.]
MQRALIFLAATGFVVGLAGSLPGRAADSLNIADEQSVALKGKVVDIVCELAHDCTPDCGGGKRQLGLKTADNKLYFAAKSHVIFAGLATDLAPYCGKEIIADGLTTANYGTKLRVHSTLQDERGRRLGRRQPLPDRLGQGAWRGAGQRGSDILVQDRPGHPRRGRSSWQAGA